jgi:type IV secretory pathway VirB10-like protein
MSSNQRNSRERKVHNRSQQREETLAVSRRIGVRFVQFQTLRRGTSQNHTHNQDPPSHTPLHPQSPITTPIHQPPVQQLLHSTHRTPKLRPLPPSNHRPLTVRSQRRPHKIKSTDKSLTIRRIQAVFWGFAHGDDEDVAIVAVEGEIWGVND